MHAITRYANDARRWQALVNRDRAADDVFFYSVRTTGVYCRPSCPSKLAKRLNVRFFGTCADAERAGFRPCKRCRPNDVTLGVRHADAVAKACRLMDKANGSDRFTDLAQAVGMSPFHFHRVFKMVTGITPKAYAAGRRARRAQESLANGATVTRALHGAGFGSSGRFYAAASKRLGMTPSAYRSGGAGTSIRFGVGTCSLGFVLTAVTDKGVCAVFLGDDPEALALELKRRFPKASVTGPDPRLDRFVAKVVALAEKPALGLDLPLDIRGTAFQIRVWEALRKIPPGRTATYTEIAQRIGQPKAVRAVAGACAANPIALAIPCHRVVRTDKSLAGYRWGVKRKEELLRRERTG